jgi:putative hemolysin
MFSQSNIIHIDLEAVIARYMASSWKNIPSAFRSLIVRLVHRILSLDQIEYLLNMHPGVRGVSLLDDIFEYLDVSYLVSSREVERVPATGRVVCVSNHPLGGLDGLVILKALLEVRPDVRIVANDVLLVLEGLAELFLPVDVYSCFNTKADFLRIDEALEHNEAIVFFPAGEVSRISLRGIADTRWHAGALRFAQRHQAPILPMYVGANNSAVFYGISFISKKVSSLLLSHEMFRKNKKPVRLHIGELIPNNAFLQLHPKTATKLMRKQVESLPLGKKGPFRTERGIVRPIERRMLRRELDAAIYLGSPAPYKRLYLAGANGSPSVVREIARLREVTFRNVGEGTGKRLDKDKYDQSYRHLILWDDEQLEIVGAYRLGFCDEILPRQGIYGLYTSSLFRFSEEFIQRLPYSIEMGRSFIQRQYWNSHALEYLWSGIGVVIENEPTVKYLYGPVSINGTYSNEAKEALVYVCSKWYGALEGYVTSLHRYCIPEEKKHALQEYFCGTTYNEDLNKLKLRLRAVGVTIPTLLRQYSGLCSPEGVRFCDFGIDASFGSCIDGFIQLELAYLTSEKYERYIGQYKSVLAYPGRTKMELLETAFAAS